MSWLEGTRARLRLLFARRAAEVRMDEEFRFHVEMETERLVREAGLDAAEARRRALVAFGGRDRYREEMRAGRGLAWLSGLRLDLKLGVRMLVKYPVLTLASVLSLAVAVALAASWFEFMTDMARPRLPFPDADRVVEIENRDLVSAGDERRLLYDFEIWREEVESVEVLSALSHVEYSVRTEDDRFANLRGMRVTPSAFRLARVPPLFGRRLTEADGRPDAPLAAVLGYAAWQRLYDGDRSVLGASIRLGSEVATVVGVMPEGFGLWANDEIWTPLRETAVRYGPREGPAIEILGRLAPGFTLDEARAELATIGRRMAAQHPETHAQLRPVVFRFPGVGDMLLGAATLNLPFLLFVLVVSANVATLLFARTATRESEIALRSALGASRRRIIVQLVAEALALTLSAAALGLAVAGWGLPRGMDLFWEVQQMREPMWWHSGLSVTTGLYVFVLAVLGALLIGGFPALRVTGRRLRHRLTQPGAGGSAMRFGAVATGVIVVQVALCVAFIPVPILTVREQLPERGETAFNAQAFLTGRLTLQPGPGGQARGARAGEQADDPGAAALFDEVGRRLAAQPGIVAVTRASRIPGFNHPIERIGIEGDSMRIVGARMLAIDPNFFDVMDARIVRGRGFRPEDVTAASRVAIVDEAWAAETFRGDPIGRRIRFPAEGEERAAPGYEIIGVVAGMPRAIGPGTEVGVYRPLRPEAHASVQVYLRAGQGAAELVPQIEDLVSAVDSRLAIADLKRLHDVWRPVQRSDAFYTAALVVVAGIILLFALMGIYALTSFTVTRRVREIGIRAALGAGPRRILVSIFARTLGRIGLGVVAGAALVSLKLARSPDGLLLVGGVAAGVVVVGLAGCILPARRALRVQPTEALRAE